MNKKEINGKTTECASKMHILLFITGFILLGAVLELIFGENATKVFPIVLIAMYIIYIYIKYLKQFKISKLLNLRVNNVNGG
ncbi:MULTISPECIES: hypothetical protein [Methanobacterium]|uniref:Uncharacterized protein n=1 Tax=Methanobacterium veterum TaxID=408577 RepID=A0A9E4ZYB3_9EURY|nr:MULTISPECIES: hypothetical protein [Methanobacterium]MCZ3364550.1 hypothetical protein [Methanobacterium veterum]MCZ3372304.1 hypothetical protein [Methanobacterium veterum]